MIDFFFSFLQIGNFGLSTLNIFRCYLKYVMFDVILKKHYYEYKFPIDSAIYLYDYKHLFVVSVACCVTHHDMHATLSLFSGVWFGEETLHT